MSWLTHRHDVARQCDHDQTVTFLWTHCFSWQWKRPIIFVIIWEGWKKNITKTSTQNWPVMERRKEFEGERILSSTNTGFQEISSQTKSRELSRSQMKKKIFLLIKTCKMFWGNLFSNLTIAQSNAISEMKQIRSWSNPNRGKKVSPIKILYSDKTLFSK